MELFVEALEFPRFDVYVPSRSGRRGRRCKSPAPCARGVAGAPEGRPRVLDADRDARAVYEASAAASAPGAERERGPVESA